MKYRNGRTYIFHIVSKNVVFDAGPQESDAFTNLLSKNQNEHFEKSLFSLSPGTDEKNVLRFS